MEIKNCPFCGKEAFLDQYEEWYDCAKHPTVYYGVGCKTDDCYCCDRDFYCRSEEEAVNEWNNRPEKSTIYEICNAYESGYGHGYEQDGKNENYYNNSDLNEAYQHGYNIGFDKRSEEKNIIIE